MRIYKIACSVNLFNGCLCCLETSHLIGSAYCLTVFFSVGMSTDRGVYWGDYKKTILVKSVKFWGGQCYFWRFTAAECFYHIFIFHEPFLCVNGENYSRRYQIFTWYERALLYMLEVLLFSILYLLEATFDVWLWP